MRRSQLSRVLAAVAACSLFTAPALTASATVTADMNLDVRVTESASKDLGTARLNHVWGSVKHILSGTTAAKIDRVWSDQRSLAATTENIDLSGTLTSQLDGSVVSFDGGVVILIVENTSTTTGADLKIGGAAATQFVGFVADSSDKIVVPPGGFVVLYAGAVDDKVAASGASDLLKIDSGAATITYNILVAGRSA